MNDDNTVFESKEAEETPESPSFLNELGANVIATVAKTTYEHFLGHLLDGTPRKK